MTRTDPDLTAVRDLPVGATEPSDESVARTWYLLNARQAATRERAPRRPARWLVPVTAGLVVTAVALGAVTVGGLGGHRFATPNIALVKASHQPLPTARGTNPALSRTTPEAIAALEELARTAERASAVDLLPGRLVHVLTEGWGAALSGGTGTVRFQPREVWLDPQGMIALKLLNGDENMFESMFADHEGNMEHARSFLRDNGPSIEVPTPQWLAQLPTDPRPLLALLRADVEDNETWTKDHMLWDAMAGLYHDCDILLSPQLRAALLRAFQGMDGLTVGKVMIDDSELVAIRQTDGDSADEILFDPVTAWAVGWRDIDLGDELTLLPPRSGPKFDPLVSYHATWRQTIVGSVDER
ncbi:hypothetical protein [Catellatospora chokoriensis]|uniref:CU044_5270 family protein n=1 Tax=Catellatospora chokoriensis TaxID=310353 RepID=A0A8J3NPG5_9ACTN|nr:hypothetical protein [Catellatospora chokoriensis]GIF87925.1 hypothetical protein Cch02nite_13690 [Catellatospora chokoriensis]